VSYNKFQKKLRNMQYFKESFM